MNFIHTILAIGIGATIGASCRYYITIMVLQVFQKEAFYGTLIANILGSFIAGIAVFIIIEKSMVGQIYKLLLIVGLAGSLTTMSALSIESINMLTNGNYSQAFFNVILNILFSLSATIIGIFITKYLFNLISGYGG